MLGFNIQEETILNWKNLWRGEDEVFWIIVSKEVKVVIKAFGLNLEESFYSIIVKLSDA